jgi:hypothetical protein
LHQEVADASAKGDARGKREPDNGGFERSDVREHASIGAVGAAFRKLGRVLFGGSFVGLRRSAQ